MKRLVIAIDCDDVLVQTKEYFVRMYNALHGTHVTLEDTRNLNREIWEADEKEILRRWAALAETDEYKLLKPDSEVVTVLKKLAVHHELHLITARKEEERAFTQEMLDHELKGTFTSMEFVGWKGSKGQVCKRIKADVLIDDTASHLHDALECGLPSGGALLFGDYDWNRHASSHNALVHCHDWLAVQQVINKIARR